MPLNSIRSCLCLTLLMFFFFNDTATTEIYTLSLHDALPIYGLGKAPDWYHSTERGVNGAVATAGPGRTSARRARAARRSEEHTSELQSQSNLVCRLLLEKTNQNVSARIRQARVSVQRLGELR